MAEINSVFGQAASTPEPTEFLKQQNADIHPEYSTTEALEASYELSDMEDTTSSILNLADQALSRKGEKVSKEVLRKQYPSISSEIQDDGYLEEYKIKNERFERRMALQNIIANSPNSTMHSLGNFMASILGSANVVDLAVSSVAANSGILKPVIGSLSQSMQFGVSNLIENTISEAVTGSSQLADLQKYGVGDALANVAIGTAIGQGAYTVLPKSVKDAINKVEQVEAKRSTMALINDKEGKIPTDVSEWDLPPQFLPEPPDDVPHFLPDVPEESPPRFLPDTPTVSEFEAKYNAPENDYTYDKKLTDDMRVQSLKKTDPSWAEVAAIFDMEIEELQGMVLNKQLSPDEFEAINLHKDLLSEKNEIVKGVQDCLKKTKGIV